MTLTRRQLLAAPFVLLALALVALLRPFARSLPVARLRGTGPAHYKFLMNSLYGKFSTPIRYCDVSSAYPKAMMDAARRHNELYRAALRHPRLRYIDADSAVIG